MLRYNYVMIFKYGSLASTTELCATRGVKIHRFVDIWRLILLYFVGLSRDLLLPLEHSTHIWNANVEAEFNLPGFALISGWECGT